MKMCEVTFLPDQKKVMVPYHTSLFEAARKASVAIRSRCGGKAGCLMCKVHVEQPNGLAPIKQNELYKLSNWVDEGYRLSCQATVIANCIVTVPEDPLKAAIRAQLAEQKKNEEF